VLRESLTSLGVKGVYIVTGVKGESNTSKVLKVTGVQ